MATTLLLDLRCDEGHVFQCGLYLREMTNKLVEWHIHVHLHIYFMLYLLNIE